MHIQVDRQVLMQALQSSSHSRILLCRDYMVGKESFRESLDIDGVGICGGNVTLTIGRVKMESPLGPKPESPTA